HNNKRITVSVAKNSCTGTKAFNSTTTTNGKGKSTSNTTVQGLRGINAVPKTWFFAISDPTQQGAPVVGCAPVTANGRTGTVTLSATTTTPPVATPTTPVTTDPVATPTTPVTTDPTMPATTDPAATPTTPATTDPAACTGTFTSSV